MKREMASMNNINNSNINNSSLSMNNTRTDNKSINDIYSLTSLHNLTNNLNNNNNNTNNTNNNNNNNDIINMTFGVDSKAQKLPMNNISGIYDLMKQNVGVHNQNITIDNKINNNNNINNTNNIPMNNLSNNYRNRNIGVYDLSSLNSIGNPNSDINNNNNHNVLIKNNSTLNLSMNNISETQGDSNKGVYDITSLNIYNNNNSNNNSNNDNISLSSINNNQRTNVGISSDVYDVSTVSSQNIKNNNILSAKITTNNIRNNNYKKSASHSSNINPTNNPDVLYIDYSQPVINNTNNVNSGNNLNVNNIPRDTTIVIPDLKASNNSNININENGKKKSFNIIDLTNDNNDDDVKIISSTYNNRVNPYKRTRIEETNTNSNLMFNSNYKSNNEVIDLTSDNYTLVKEPIQCFGTISTFVYCVKNPIFYSIPNDLSVQLYPYKNNLHVLIERNGPVAVGILEKTVSECLYPLFNALKYGALIPKTLRMHAQNTLRIEITLFGTKSVAKFLGPLLYQKKVNISLPSIAIPAGMVYYNPVTGFGHIPIDDKYKQAVGLPLSTTNPNSNNAYQNMKTQIDKVFDSLKSIDELPELSPNKLIKTPLYKYQKQALYFMVQREKDANEEYFKNDSLWKLKESKLKGYPPEYVNSITKAISKRMPKKVQGGIIADDMGLGKTFQMLCLIMNYYNEVKTKDDVSSDTPDIDLSEDYLKEEDSDIEIISIKNSEGETKMEKSYINSKATLIICPLSVVSNWDEQINTHIGEGILKVYIHHGTHRLKDPEKIANYDIVISTYNVLALEYNKEKNNENYCAPLHKIDWFRIILDEAHYIKEAQTLQSRAACELTGKRRWCLSGTPMQNKIDDLYGLIKFLGLEPFNKKSVWVNYISKPMRYYDKIGISSLQTLMKSIAIRRTKDSTFNGKKLIELPPKSSEYVKLQLSPEAREVYSRVLKQGKLIFTGLVNQGTWAKHYVHILEIILRLRQIATHLSLCSNKDLTSLNDLAMPMLKEESVTDESKALEIYNILKESAENQCLLCGYDVDNLDRRGYITSCGHLYCADCLKSKSVFTCVECQKDVSKNNAIIIPKIESKSTEFFFNEVETDSVNKKVNRLINDLLRDKQMNDKSIVFSQWTKVFDLLDGPLKKANINYVRLDGQMSRIKRNESIQKFKDDPNISVMLISLKAGGLGLTLTVASRVYLFEPHFNPAAENQAIDRVHRLGQNKPVFVYHYIMENTIEENIVNLQKKKRTLFSLTFNRNKKLTKEEIENRRLADLKYLFK